MQAIIHALQEGAPFSYINICVLILAIATIIERFIFILTKYKVDTKEFMSQIRKLINADNIDRAIKLCEAAPLPVLEVVRAGLTKVNRGEEAVIAGIEEAMGEVLPELEKRIGSLWSLANIATLIGLLGTVKGLIVAFNAVASGDEMSPSDKQQVLMGGIGEAMWNTAFGLGIAVFCMAFHLVLHSKAKKHKLELEKATMKLENLLTLRRAG